MPAFEGTKECDRGDDRQPPHRRLARRRRHCTGHGQLFARNIATEGYGRAIDWTDKEPREVAAGHVDEFVSREPIQYGPGEAVSLDLPVRETPTFHDNDLDALGQG